MKQSIIITAAATLALFLFACATPNTPPATSASATASAVKAYPLDACLVTGEPLDGGPVTTYNGQEVKFCCSGCLDAFNRDPERYMAALP